MNVLAKSFRAAPTKNAFRQSPALYSAPIPPTPPTPQAPPPALPPIPEIVRTGKKRIVLTYEPMSISPWRLPGLNSAPEWFRKYTHISFVGFGVVAVLQYAYRRHLGANPQPECEIKQLYGRPTYATDLVVNEKS